MILYYCLGGGLGHITRFLAFRHTFAVEPELITACKSIANGQMELEDTRIHVPNDFDVSSRESFREWISMIIAANPPAQFIIDSFPGGILGELCDLPALANIDCVYLARHLKWQEYLHRVQGKMPEFSQICLLEKLSQDHFDFLEEQRAPLKKLKLVDPAAPEVSDLPDDYWLVIHSDAGNELQSLWEFAQESAKLEVVKPFFVVVCPGKKPDFIPPGILHLDIYPAHGMFQAAARVFSGGGFNIVRQMEPFRSKHRILPFPRSLDDQFFRAREIQAQKEANLKEQLES